MTAERERAAVVASVTEAEQIEIYKKAFRWFLKYPEYKPNPDYLDFVSRDVGAARALYELDPIPPIAEREAIEHGVHLKEDRP